MKISTLLIPFVSMFFLFNFYSNQDRIWFEWLNYVNDIQEEWTLIETETFSIWNNISRFQDFKSLEKKTKTLLVLIDEMKQKHDSEKKKYGEKYLTFFNLSAQYISALENAISNLRVILEHLNNKTNDLNSYTWKEYSADIDNYNKSVKYYHDLGNKMNTEFKRIQQIN